MVKIKLNDGFECEINKDNLDDMELVDKIAEADEGNVLAVSVVITKLLGQDNKKKLYDHLRVNGIVPITKVSNAIVEIMQKLGTDGKNS